MKKELIINCIFTIFTSMLGFIQNKYFIKYMGIDILGIMKLFSQFLAYLNIVEMGLGSASAFALYKPLAEKNYKQISVVVNTIENIYNKIAILIMGLGVCCIPLIPFFIEKTALGNKIYLYWILYVFNTVSTYLYIKYIILFTANQEFIYVRIIQSTSKILFQILQIFFIVKYQSFFIFIILLILDNLAQFIFFKIHYQKNYSYIIKTKEKYDGIKTDIKNLFWHKVGGLVVFNTDLLLISKFVSLEIVGIYASYQMVLSTINIVIGIITGIISPKIGKYSSISKKEEIYNLFKKINILFLGLGIFLTFSTYKLLDSFIALWIGKEFIFSTITTVLILVNIFINIVRKVLDIFKEVNGYFDDIQSPILESIINLVTSLILGYRYGLNGIIIGTIVSNVIVIMIYKPILVFKRCFDQDWREYIKVYGSYLILTLLSLIILNVVINPFLRDNINTWIDWIVYAVIISIISIISIFIVFLLNKEFREIVRKYIIKTRRSNL